MNIFSFSPFGYEGSLVTVEVDLRRGIPAVDVVGLADGAVKESRERMRSAIRNSGFEFPLERVLISLSPADLKKEGAGFDLALALAVLDAQKKEDESYRQKTENDSILIMGELELSGQSRGVRGVHAAAATAVEAGICYCIVPMENEEEAKDVSGMKVYPAENLVQSFMALQHKEWFTEKQEISSANIQEQVLFPDFSPEQEFSLVKGQEKLIRGLQIAAAGTHNLLAFGPPGCGKTLSIQKFPALLPLLTEQEAQSVTRIHSIAGLTVSKKSIGKQGDFRMPHQTASIEGICGGGTNCRPGELSLAHNGVLFLDEAAEFKTSVLQMLRVPLETGSITLSRAGRSTVYPARFQLLMATNPCPCGNYGNPTKICLCSMRSIELYWKKFCGPLLDRIDIRIEVQAVPENLNTEKQPLSTQELRVQIATATKIQRRRGKKNAFLTLQEIGEICVLDEKARNFLETQSEKNEFSQRAVAGCKKIARTIADMKGKEKIEIEDLMEAVDFRKTPKPLEIFSAGG